MVTAVQCVIAKLLAPLWRKVEEDEVDGLFGAAMEEVRNLRCGVVTLLCQDYGMIDDDVYFTTGEVLGGVPLRVGDAVNGLAVRDSAQGGWKALRVEKNADAWEEGGGGASLEADRNQLRPLIGTVTSCDRDGGFINQTTFFPRQALCDGFEPMKGDWVQAQYFISPTQWSSQARSVSPLRYRRMDQVRVSSVFGSSGVVEDSVFFSLDNLLLPAGYRPSPGDMVSLVVVESSQSFYCWRALCMATSEHSMNTVNNRSIPEAEINSLLEDKGGLVVGDKTHFGVLLLGESRELVVWIQNQGSETHRLKCCEFAGWDSEEQFNLGTVTDPPGQRKGVVQLPALTQILYRGIRGLSSKRTPMVGPALYPQSGSAGPTALLNGDGKEMSEIDGDVVGENGEAHQDTVHKLAIRTDERDVEIAPGEKVSVKVGCRAKNLGRCAELLLLHFPSFSIGRRLEVTVGCKEESLLQPFAPYCPAAPLPLPQAAQVVTVMAAHPPQRLTKRHLPNFLSNYPVPQALRDCMEADRDVLVAQPCLGETLSAANMRLRFSSLLWLEELQAENELREFNISGALLRRGAIYLHLEVLGLAEGRPSLFIGDRVALKKPISGGVVMEYIGYVTEISDEDVSLRVNTEFQHGYLGEPLDVEFTFNRLSMRRCHLALDQNKHFEENVFFPKAVTLQAPLWTGEWGPEEVKEGTLTTDGVKLSSVSVDMVSKATQTKPDSRLPSKPIPNPGQLFNQQLNPSQREAVKRILAGECRPTPYILFGPPGTGKTITLIESILQVYHRLPSSRVLVCTPSNSAADLVCIRLHESGYLNAASLARVNASCRQEEAIPEVLRQYSQAGEDIRHASFHRIVVSTCSSAGMFYQIGLRVGHFTHVFLDEAGQATEPEALIPLGLLSERDGQIVLAGDPRQLGPIVKSKLAQAFGLGMSLLERLMANPLYSRENGGYNPVLVTKLVYNYRSHEALLALPSKLFYNGELCVRAQRFVVDSLCHWSRLPTKGFPLIFHGVRGTEMREGNNPSWFNPGEAVQVMLYSCQLAKKLYNPVAASDIGIIAPYRKQSEKIRVLLHRVGLSDIKVGSVEEFQGQEFLVIILSTVRANESVQGNDLQSILGFLSNPKRFNVAITRPKALLIVVGNPHILVKDPCFTALLQYCFENGAYLGCDPPTCLRAAHQAASEKEE
ncbi:RNA helicase Mov10l1 isoform X1 [Salvelinus fontinalis]|uniref:RNA helicase Mov10l1 isoform X1 n=2 Tax=Salvelinus fontinalis TaxID=8038 RepID=UPI0024852E10|nr:RNA helicase Mov10l1 isoform X1 [Salvelinus fontinalis]XP_055790487.1 RNA helicase Mov10l1 isoform X1 [Salvelinus fontinalis]